jgi:N-acetylmuramoyl-L-alanine amidase
MPAVLNEGAFVDNKQDVEDWDEDAELRKLAIAYAEATAEAMKLERKPQPEQKLYRVQVGAYAKRENALAMAEKLKADGYDTIIV